MTLKEGRLIFQQAKNKLLNTKFGDDKLLTDLKDKFLNLDNLIEQNNFDKAEIIKQQSEILDLLIKNKVYGLEKLFDK